MSDKVLPRPKILVVDDTPANLLVMRKLLAKADADLVEVGSGADALSACLDQEFALILLDVNMPEMDGFEVASLLAEEERNRLTPVIFVTAAYSDDIHRLKGYHAGAVDYIAKPINDQILRSKVQVFLELWTARQELKAFSASLNERNRQLEHEVRERQRIEKEVRHQAHHDALTGLPNRILFLDRLDTAIERAARHHIGFALLYIDIDGFKPVNDQHGHAAGDALLRQIGERLLGTVRRSDTVARLGGDEFAVILEEIHDSTEAQRMGTQLCAALAVPFPLDAAGQPVEVQIGGSIGIALHPLHGLLRDRLLSAADAAMYEAKRGGRNQCRVAPAGG
jgi:diguanylate cyclase (GGDEF)-like protein